MDLIMEQFPIVFNALNVGFLQTLKLFFCDTSGSNPAGTGHIFRIDVTVQTAKLYYKDYCMDHQRYSSDDPIADYLLFSGDRSGQ